MPIARRSTTWVEAGRGRSCRSFVGQLFIMPPRRPCTLGHAWRTFCDARSVPWRIVLSGRCTMRQPPGRRRGPGPSWSARPSRPRLPVAACSYRFRRIHHGRPSRPRRPWRQRPLRGHGSRRREGRKDVMPLGHRVPLGRRVPPGLRTALRRRLFDPPPSRPLPPCCLLAPARCC